MFWDNFYALCLAHETKPNPVAKKLGFSSATVTKWKSGTSPNLNAAANIAEYFHVTIDELLYGLSSQCYRCGYDLNPSYASYCKKCGELLNDNFCTNPDCDADNRYDTTGATPLSVDCEYCPYCGSESRYKAEGLFDLPKGGSQIMSKNDKEWLSLIHQLPPDAQQEFRGEIKGYLKCLNGKNIKTDESLEKTGTTNTAK